MTSLRHTPDPGTDHGSDPRDGYLDAARDCILDLGWRRTTLTEVARRAGVSRMTIYRTWSDMQQPLGDRGRPAGRRPRGHGPHAAGQRAVPADRRARPRAAAPLPARAPGPLAG